LHSSTMFKKFPAVITLCANAALDYSVILPDIQTFFSQQVITMKGFFPFLIAKGINVDFQQLGFTK